MPNNIFPKDFFWGASTASHQVEGQTDNNQWSHWEVKNAQLLAINAQEKLKNLANYAQIISEASDPNNYISGKGIDHFHLYKDDFDLLKKLNMNSYRFSIEWSRIEPKEGHWDQVAIDHYKQYLLEMKNRHIEPFLTLWHWSIPQWFASKGGFRKKANIKYFNRYASKVADEFGENLTYIIILNEPNVYSAFSYFAGEWPPQEKSLWLTLRVYYNLTLAHKTVYRNLKKSQANFQIGIAAQLTNSRPASHNPLEKVILRFHDYVWNWWFLNRIKSHLDFIGVNYYFTEYYNWRHQLKNPKKPTNDLGWYMEPSGIYRLLMKVNSRYHKPIIITENGLADATDTKRKWWIKQTLNSLQLAIDSGVDLKGYLHWSLLDNFEWSSGWWPKFGLIAIDRKTMKRSIRPSAKWFGKQILLLSEK